MSGTAKTKHQQHQHLKQLIAEHLHIHHGLSDDDIAMADVAANGDCRIPMIRKPYNKELRGLVDQLLHLRGKHRGPLLEQARGEKSVPMSSTAVYHLRKRRKDQLEADVAKQKVAGKQLEFETSSHTEASKDHVLIELMSRLQAIESHLADIEIASSTQARNEVGETSEDDVAGPQSTTAGLTTVAIPSSLLAEIRTEVARRSNEQGRRLSSWELIAEAWINRSST